MNATCKAVTASGFMCGNGLPCTYHPAPAPRIDSIAAVKRLPIGTRLYLVASLHGPQAPSARVIKQVRSKDIVLTIADASHKHCGQDSYLTLGGVVIEPTPTGFRVRAKDSGAPTYAEYAFTEPLATK